ncbi:hypothetical protein SEA_RASPUTIA_75 [Microbacterium phage Rasputia]|nr:hypothetical protein SEA_RASPUTIA_75 [Microbacterium phage Rasputia]
MSVNADVKQRVRIEKRLQGLERAAARNGRYVLPPRLAAVLSSVADANEFSGSGWFRVGPATTNAPTPADYVVEQYELDSTSRYQQAWKIGSPATQIFAERWTRTRTAAGVWTAWKIISQPTKSFTPSATTITVGNGSISGTYSISDGILTGRIVLTVGSTTVVNTDCQFDHPPVPFVGSTMSAGRSRMTDTSTGQNVIGSVLVNSSKIYNRLQAVVNAPDGELSYLAELTMIASRPFTWAAGDSMVLDFSYPVV